MGCLLSSFRTLPPFSLVYDLLHLGCAGTPYISTIYSSVADMANTARLTGAMQRSFGIAVCQSLEYP